jgi:hypothetical protein
MRQEPQDPEPEDPQPTQPQDSEEKPPRPPRRFGIDENPTDNKPTPWGGPPPP